MTGLGEFKSIILVIVGAALTIVGSKMSDDVTRSLGVGIVMGALGMSLPGQTHRDPQQRTRATDEPQERGPSGR